MNYLPPISPISPQEHNFKKQLELLSRPGILTGHLIVKEQGALSQTNFLHVLWEKFKGVCGFRNWTNNRLVEFKTLQFLAEGRMWIKTEKDIERVNILASRVGLTPSTKNDHSELQQLINEICQPPLKSGKKVDQTTDLLNQFVIHYKKELRPFAKEITKVNQVFDCAFFPNMVTAPLIQHSEKDFTEEDKETESEDHPHSTSQQDNEQAQDQNSSETLSTLALLTEENTFSQAAILPKSDPSHLLKIPELSDDSLKTVSAPLSLKEEEKTEVIQHKPEPAIKAKILSSRELSSNKWKIAGKAALIATGTLVVLAATYYAWQYLSSTSEMANDPPSSADAAGFNLINRDISFIWPPKELALPHNSMITGQTSQDFSFDQMPSTNSTSNSLDICAQTFSTLTENAQHVSQRAIEAFTNLTQSTKDIVNSSLPICSPGDNPDISLNSTIFDFVDNLENSLVIQDEKHTTRETLEETAKSTFNQTTQQVVNAVVEQASSIKKIGGIILLTLGTALAYGLSRAVTPKVRALTPEQFRALTPEQVRALTPAQIRALTPDQKGDLMDKYAIHNKNIGTSTLSSDQLRALTTLSPDKPTVSLINRQEKKLGYCGRYCINNALQEDVLSQEEFLELTEEYLIKKLGYRENEANEFINNPDTFGVDCNIINYIFEEKFTVKLRIEEISKLIQPNQSKQQALEQFIGDSDWAIIANPSNKIYEMPSVTAAQYPFTNGHLAAISKDKEGKWWYIDSRAENPINIDLAIIPSAFILISSNNNSKTEDIKNLAKSHAQTNSIQDLNKLTPEQMSALKPAHIRALTPEQINTIAPEQINAMTLKQISILTSKQVNALTPEQINAMTPDQKGDLMDKHAIYDKNLGKSSLSHNQFQAMILSSDKPTVSLINKQDEEKKHLGCCYCINNAFQKDVLSQEEFLKLTNNYYVEILDCSQAEANEFTTKPDFGVNCDIIKYIFKEKFKIDLSYTEISNLIQSNQPKQQALVKFIGDSDWAIIVNESDKIYEMPSTSDVPYLFTMGHSASISKDKEGKWWYLDSRAENPINIDLAIIPSSFTLIIPDSKAEVIPDSKAEDVKNSAQNSTQIIEKPIQVAEEPIQVAEELISDTQKSREELLARKELGKGILKDLIKNKILTFRNQPIVENDIEEKLKSKEAYLILLKISASLEKLKMSELDQYLMGESNESHKSLYDIHNAILALEGIKEKYLKHLLTQNKNFENIFAIIQNLIGKDREFPIDFKIALMNLMPSKEDQTLLLSYIKTAYNEKEKILRPSLEQSISSSDKIGENPIQNFFSFEVQPKIFENSGNFNDYLAENLIKNMNAFNMWIIASAGSEFNTQMITDSIELGLNSETKETLREINALKLNKNLAPFLLLEEKKLAENHFRPWTQYGIQVENKWSIKENLLIWTGIFATKQSNGTYRKSISNYTIDFSCLGDLNEDEKKIALHFIADHCQSGKSIKGKKDLSFAPSYLLPLLNKDSNFWLWRISGSSNEIEQTASDSYSKLLPKIIEKYSNLLKISDGFSQEIQKAMIETFVDKSDNQEAYEKNVKYYFDNLILDTLPNFDLSVFDEEDIFNPESDDVVTIEPGGAYPEDSSSQPSSHSLLTYSMGYLGNALTSLSSHVASPVSAALTWMDDPEWAKDKYKLALNQMLNSLDTHIGNSKLKTSIEHLLATQKEPDACYAHALFLKHLREILVSNEFKEELAEKIKNNSNNPGVDFILQICQKRFEEGNFYSFCHELVSEILPENSGELSDSDFDVIDHVDPSKKLLQIDVDSKKLMGHLNLNFDPHLQGNIPFVLGTVEIDNKPIKLLRTGTPTIEGFIGKAQINPEFRGYIQSLQLQKKKHLYISLQNDQSKNFISGDESGRNGAIKGLQEDFPETFFAVVLAQDSHFYKQVDKWGRPLGEENANDFKAIFRREMLLSETTGFYFPPKWKEDPNFRMGLSQLLEDVHSTVFEDKSDFTRQEKQDFIEIYYAYLSIFLMNYCKADNANITCKDAIDRAGKLNSLVLKLIMTIQGKADDETQKRIHQVWTHAPAFFVKSQAIIKSHSKTDPSNGRRERLMSAYKVLTNREVALRIKNNTVKTLQEEERKIIPIAQNSEIKI